MGRTAVVERKTKETEIRVMLNVDGTGKSEVVSPVGFFNHMLESFAKHGLFDLEVIAEGDTHVDQHHLIEDTGIVIGQAFHQCLGDRQGIFRAGFFMFPMDEALAVAAVDFGGRPFLQYEMDFKTQFCGTMEIGLLEDFFQALSVNCRANIVVRTPQGRSDHHKAEAAFKALARAMRNACEIDPRNSGTIPSTKGVI